MTKKYDYMEAMKNDIKEYLEDNFEYKYFDYEDRDELAEDIYEDLWIEDSVTGNGSGSYTFCRQTAKEYVTNNIDLCQEALECFCVEAQEVGKRFLSKDWEYFDVTIRCYCLMEAINNVLDEMEA